jgi:predicted nucleic-acid-binding protein
VIGLDTDVLLRSLLHDQGAEGVRARELVERRCAEQEPAVVNHVVLCEAVWVLARTYRYSRSQILQALVTILATPAFLVPDRALVEEAMQIFQTGSADFADALIGVLNRNAGCATTYTFDRRAAEMAELSLVD